MCFASTQHVPAPIAQPNFIAYISSDSLRPERSTTIVLPTVDETVTGTSVQISARAAWGGRGAPPSAGISQRIP